MRMSVAKANAPFSEGLIKLMEERGVKQVYVAKKAGYTAQELSDMLNGRRLIKACDIPRIAEALNVTSDDIYAAGKEAG